MENTVTISLDEYNELVEFKKNIESGKILSVKISGHNMNYFRKIEFYTNEEAMYTIKKSYDEELRSVNDKIKIIEDTQEIITHLNCRNSNLMNKLNKLNITLYELKNMNILQFIQWKKQK